VFLNEPIRNSLVLKEPIRNISFESTNEKQFYKWITVISIDYSWLTDPLLRVLLLFSGVCTGSLFPSFS